MYSEVLNEHIIKCKSHTNAPYAVNLPLLYPNAEKHIETIIFHKPIVFIQMARRLEEELKIKLK